MAVSAECYDWCERQPGSRGSCNPPSAESREGLEHLLQAWAAATLSDVSGTGAALLQTEQKLWNHSATLMVSPSCSTPSAWNGDCGTDTTSQAQKYTCSHLPRSRGSRAHGPFLLQCYQTCCRPHEANRCVQINSRAFSFAATTCLPCCTWSAIQANACKRQLTRSAPAKRMLSLHRHAIASCHAQGD